ncbi:hypothetical protein [Limosilactobacillus mucosae]|uniref:hypothetical protein n=1 Tax=Limosilactobacillus mucosae TaxID=97478 RepID=UPI0039947343
MWTKRKQYLCGILGILIICSWGIIGLRLVQLRKYQNISQQYRAQISSINANISTKQYELKKKAAANSVTSQSRIWMTATDDATQRSVKLFNILLTFGSTAEYNHRKKLARPYLDSASLKNNQLFGSDNDGSGGHYIDISGLNSRYSSSVLSAGMANGNQIPVLIKSSLEANNGVSEDVFVADYDYKNHKFLNLIKLSNLVQSASNN